MSTGKVKGPKGEVGSVHTDNTFRAVNLIKEIDNTIT